MIAQFKKVDHKKAFKRDIKYTLLMNTIKKYSFLGISIVLL